MDNPEKLATLSKKWDESKQNKQTKTQSRKLKI